MPGKRKSRPVFIQSWIHHFVVNNIIRVFRFSTEERTGFSQEYCDWGLAQDRSAFLCYSLLFCKTLEHEPSPSFIFTRFSLSQQVNMIYKILYFSVSAMPSPQWVNQKNLLITSVLIYQLWINAITLVSKESRNYLN